MLKIGITGGIGSGKTTIAKIFEILDIPVYYADQEAKSLMVENPSVRQKLLSLFGKQVFSGEALNRDFISDQVFKDSDKLRQLNEIVHPAVGEHFLQWAANQKSPYVLKEAALLFESGANEQLDFVIGISCPLEQRIERVMKRNDLQKSEVMARIEHQMDDAEKMKRCDFIIFNADETPVIPQVLHLHDLLKSKTEQPQS